MPDNQQLKSEPKFNTEHVNTESKSLIERMPLSVTWAVFIILLSILGAVVYFVFFSPQSMQFMRKDMSIFISDNSTDVMQEDNADGQLEDYAESMILYEKPKYHISFDYPQDWTIQEDDIDNISNPGFKVRLESAASDDSMTISVTEKYPNTFDFFDPVSAPSFVPDEELFKKEHENGFCDVLACSDPFTSFWFEKNGYFYTFVIDTLEPSMIDNFIFKSVKVDPVSGSEWITYTNDEYGYSFAYPDNWILENGLINPTAIQYHPIGSNTAAINFGVYSENQELYRSSDSVYDYNLIASRIEKYEDTAMVIEFIINNHVFRSYEYVDDGSLEGDSVGEVYMFVSDPFEVGGEEFRLALSWIENPGGYTENPYVKNTFIEMLSTIKISPDLLKDESVLYTNNNYGFGINLPKGWEMQEASSVDGEGFFVLEGDKEVRILPSGGFDTGITCSAPGVGFVAGKETRATNCDVNGVMVIHHFLPNEDLPSGWVSCTDEYKNCHRIEIYSPNAGASKELLDILDTFTLN
ncbi:MAG: hypothetical protein ACPGO5_02570 [Patescibacteria group bacterium]